MTDLTDDTLKQIRIAAVSTMTKAEKTHYLYSSGWRCAGGNRWRNRDGSYASFGAAVQAQLLADLDES